MSTIPQNETGCREEYFAGTLPFTTIYENGMPTMSRSLSEPFDDEEEWNSYRLDQSIVQPVAAFEKEVHDLEAPNGREDERNSVLSLFSMELLCAHAAVIAVTILLTLAPRDGVKAISIAARIASIITFTAVLPFKFVRTLREIDLDDAEMDDELSEDDVSEDKLLDFTSDPAFLLVKLATEVESIWVLIFGVVWLCTNPITLWCLARLFKDW